MRQLVSRGQPEKLPHKLHAVHHITGGGKDGVVRGSEGKRCRRVRGGVVRVAGVGLVEGAEFEAFPAFLGSGDWEGKNIWACDVSEGL